MWTFRVFPGQAWCQLNLHAALGQFANHDLAKGATSGFRKMSAMGRRIQRSPFSIRAPNRLLNPDVGVDMRFPRLVLDVHEGQGQNMSRHPDHLAVLPRPYGRLLELPHRFARHRFHDGDCFGDPRATGCSQQFADFRRHREHQFHWGMEPALHLRQQAVALPVSPFGQVRQQACGHPAEAPLAFPGRWCPSNLFPEVHVDDHGLHQAVTGQIAT